MLKVVSILAFAAPMGGWGGGRGRTLWVSTGSVSDWRVTVISEDVLFLSV